MPRIFLATSLSQPGFQKSFTERVRAAVRQIPIGEVRSYGEVARLAGSPGAARAVGTVMAQNFDLTVPCHRVVLSSGRVGNFNRSGINQNSSKLKVALLRKEGVVIKNGYIVSSS